MRKFILFIALFVTAALQLKAQPCDIPPSALECDGAPILCNINDLDGYCTTLPDFVNATGPNPLCSSNGGGVSNNTIWFGFVAWATNMSLSIIPSNCTSVGGQMGIQGGIYSGAGGCGNITELVCQGNCSTGPITLTSGGFIVGEVYYIIVDGCAGAVCDIKVDVLSGGGTPNTIGNIGPISGPAQVCTTKKYLYSVPKTSGASLWYWTIDGELQDDPQFATEEIELSFENPGSYMLCVDAATFCQDVDSDPVQYCTEIQVFDGSKPVSLKDYNICVGDSVFYKGTFYKDGQSFLDTLNIVAGCTIYVLNNVKHYVSKVNNLGDVFICANECFSINGIGVPPVVFCDSISNAMVTIPNYIGCDSLIIFNVKKGSAKKDTAFITVTLCDQDSLKYGNLDVDDAGLYYYTFGDQDSCQVVGLNVVLDTIPSNVLLIKCSNKPLNYLGKSYSSPGIYQGSFNTCKPNFNLIINEIECKGDFMTNQQTGTDDKTLNGKFGRSDNPKPLKTQTQENMDMVLVPNPTNGQFRLISSTSLEITDWQVFNTLGQLLLHSSKDEYLPINIDATSLSNGLYYWKGMVNGQQVLRQFMKIE